MVTEPRTFTDQLRRSPSAIPPPFRSRCECGYETQVDTMRCEWKRSSDEVLQKTGKQYIGIEVICVACKMPKHWRWECHYGH